MAPIAVYAAWKQTLHSAIDERLLGCPHAFFFYARLSDLLVVANSSLNVFIYCYFSQHFSRAVRGVTARHQRAVLRDSLDSRRETISGATARPTPSRSGGVQTFELAVRGVPLPTTSSREGDEPATMTDCEATQKQQNVTVVVTHNHDCLWPDMGHLGLHL